jgi:hypothetical protein
MKIFGRPVVKGAICMWKYTMPGHGNTGTSFRNIKRQYNMKINPMEQLSAMYFELRKAKDLLHQIKELPTFSTILNEGERGSIQQMILAIDLKMNFIHEIQVSINNLSL